MAMNMKEANASPEFQGAWHSELRASFHPLLKVNSILTHDIIHYQGHGDAVHVV
jgi:hypothetical protein